MIEPTSPATDTATRKRLALDVVARFTLLCTVASQVPYWWATSPSVTGLQLKMLAEVSDLYQVEFTQDLARPLAASAAGGALSLMVSRHPLITAWKAWIVTVPLVGIPLRLAVGPGVVAAYTYVLGSAFVRHYEASGSYHDFTAAMVRGELTRVLGLSHRAGRGLDRMDGVAAGA